MLHDMVQHLLAASERGIHWILAQQREDGSFCAPQDGIGGYYKVPYALSLTGHHREALRLANWIAKHHFTPEGDFRAPERKAIEPFHDAWPVYANAWLIQGLHRIGRWDLSLAGARFLLGYQAPIGGFYALEGETRFLEPVCTSWGGLAMLTTGHLEAARRAGDLLVHMVRSQPDTGRFYFRMDAEGRLITDVPSGAELFYYVDAGRRQQIYYNPGIALILLAHLYQATGETQYLGAGEELFAFTERCADDVHGFPPSGKLGLGCALLFAITGKSEARRAALQVGEYLTETQTAEGFWRLPDTGPYATLRERDGVEIRLDIAAEFSTFLAEISARISLQYETPSAHRVRAAQLTAEPPDGASDMNSRELMIAAMRREPAGRIPTMPQICHDLPVRLYEGEFPSPGGDWLDGLQRCIEDPSVIYDLVIRLVQHVGCDGLRLFVKPEPMRVARDGDELIVLDRQTGERIGRIDTHGGGELVPDRKPAPVESLEEYRARLDAMRLEFTDEKMELLRAARSRVPALFVASSPGGITMNTYTALRGRQQAMVDFFERPDFVEAAMDMQAEVMIERAEKLLGTGIDCLYIGDPAASASLISPRHFERFCLPAYRKFCRHFQGKETLIYIHICGNSRPILEMMADTGADAVEPLDPLGGVEVADAKRRIGGRVALMGGVNTLTLSSGTPEDVRAEAIRKCREGGPNGYILAAGDMVPPDTSLANLQAMVDVATRSLWQDRAS